MPAVPAVSRAQALRFRAAAQQLDAAPGATATADARVLDLGVQDTGHDGALWALAVRGVDVPAWPDDLALAWTLRGGPHAYRRAELPAVARALVPMSAADAAKRVFDAAKPLREAGIPLPEAWAEVGRAHAAVVTEPMVKGEVSTRLTRMLGEPYRRWCRPCQAVHLYEQTFRLPALHAGLELEPGTSPPVLAPVAGWPAEHLAGFVDAVATPYPERGVPDHLDPLRAYLRLQGPARPADVAAFLDAPAADVKRRWADLDAAGALAEVTVDGERRWVLAEDVDRLRAAADDAGGPVVRLVAPFDPWLQARDRELLVPDPARRAELWPVLGRPGAVLADGEVVGTWRPRASGRRLAVETTPWVPWDDAVRAGVDEGVARLAAQRGLAPAGA